MFKLSAYTTIVTKRVALALVFARRRFPAPKVGSRGLLRLEAHVIGHRTGGKKGQGRKPQPAVAQVGEGHGRGPYPGSSAGDRSLYRIPSGGFKPEMPTVFPSNTWLKH